MSGRDTQHGRESIYSSSNIQSIHEPGDELDGGRYTIIEIIGMGAFGAVYRVIDTIGHSYAIKALFPEDTSTDRRSKRADRPPGKPLKRTVVERFTEEAMLHGTVADHPCVLSLHRAFTHQCQYYLVLDYCGGGTLLHSITDRGVFWQDDEAITEVFLQIIDAVAHCHDRGVAHRDLKPDNILVSEDGNRYFLADFGLATSKEICGEFGAGSKHYKSPECIGTEIIGRYYNSMVSDVWSLGIILINMITGGYPWVCAHTSDPNFCKFLQDPSYLSTVLPLSEPAANLLSRVLAPIPAARISLSELRLEAACIGRWGLDDSDLAYASDTARASVFNYARILHLQYDLPPATHFPDLIRIRSLAQRKKHIQVDRRNVFSDVFMSGSTRTPPSSNTRVPGETDSQGSPRTSIVMELPRPSLKAKKSGPFLRSLRRLRIWGN